MLMMRMFSNGLILVALVLCSCAMPPKSPKNVEHHDALPEKFRFDSYGAFEPGGVSIEFKDGYIVRQKFGSHYTISGHAEAKLIETEYFVPTKDQWIEFWKELSRIRFWNWKAKYEPSDIDMIVNDGSSWKVNAVYRGRVLESFGDNAGPKVSNPKITEVADKSHSANEAFWKALCKLLSVDAD